MVDSGYVRWLQLFRERYGGDPPVRELGRRTLRQLYQKGLDPEEMAERLLAQGLPQEPSEPEITLLILKMVQAGFVMQFCYGGEAKPHWTVYVPHKRELKDFGGSSLLEALQNADKGLTRLGAYRPKKGA